MKRILLLFAMFVASSIAIYAQHVYYTCNPATINKELHQTKQPLLSEQGGWVEIPSNACKSKESMGILLYHAVFQDEYYAYELACPMCLKRDHVRHKLIMETNSTLQCTRCWSEFQNISLGITQQTNGPGTYDLKPYIVYEQSGKLIVTDRVMPQYLGI